MRYVLGAAPVSIGFAAGRTCWLLVPTRWRLRDLPPRPRASCSGQPNRGPLLRHTNTWWLRKRVSAACDTGSPHPLPRLLGDFHFDTATDLFGISTMSKSRYPNRNRWIVLGMGNTPGTLPVTVGPFTCCFLCSLTKIIHLFFFKILNLYSIYQDHLTFLCLS